MRLPPRDVLLLIAMVLAGAGCSTGPSECTTLVTLLDGGSTTYWRGCGTAPEYDCRAHLAAGEQDTELFKDNCSL